MLQTLPRGSFADAVALNLPHATAALVGSIEDACTPFRLVTGKTVEPVVTALCANCSAATKEWATDVEADTGTSPVEALICLMSNQATEIVHTYPLSLFVHARGSPGMDAEGVDLLNLSFDALRAREASDDADSCAFDCGRFSRLALKQLPSMDASAHSEFAPRIEAFLVGMMKLLDFTKIETSRVEDRRLLLDEACARLGEAFAYDPLHVLGLVALADGDVGGLVTSVSTLVHVDAQLTHRLYGVLKAILPMSGLVSEVTAAGEETETSERKHDSMAAAAGIDPEAEEEQLLEYDHIFRIADRDGTGQLAFAEFLETFRIIGVNMSETRALYMYSKFDEDCSGLVDYQEFKAMMEYYEEYFSTKLIKSIGYDFKRLMTALVGGVAVLLVLFIFIFLGVAGLAVPGPFGAVVNSLLPIVAGMGSGGGGGGEAAEGAGDLLEKVLAVVVPLIEAAMEGG